MPKTKKDSFFKKIIISIKEFDRYPEFAIHSFKEVFSYMIKLILIFSLITSFAYSYKIVQSFYNTTDEEYESIMKEYNIETLSRKEVLEYFENSNKTVMYVTIYITAFVYLFIFNIINTLLNAMILTIMGYLTTICMRFRIRLNAMFKISIYSLTLSILLSIIVVFIESFTNFKVAYYEAMYIGIAYIYVIAAISILRMDIMKNKQELLSIIEEQKRVKEELERQEEEKKEKERNKNKDNKENDDKPKEKNKKNENKEEGNNDNSEAQGDNA